MSDIRSQMCLGWLIASVVVYLLCIFHFWMKLHSSFSRSCVCCVFCVCWETARDGILYALMKPCSSVLLNNAACGLLAAITVTVYTVEVKPLWRNHNFTWSVQRESLHHRCFSFSRLAICAAVECKIWTCSMCLYLELAVFQVSSCWSGTKNN